MTQLGIKWPFSFPSHPISASALPGKTKQAKYALKFTKKHKISSFWICGQQQPINYKV